MQALTVQNEGPVTCCRIASHDDLGENPMIATGIDRVVAMHHGKKLVTTLTGSTTAVSAIGMDKQARRLAAGTDGGSLRLWDVATGEAIQGFTSSHRTTVTAIDYHPFADFMATASRDTHVRIWDLRKKSCLQVYRHKEGVAAPIETVRVAPDGRTAASGCGDGTIRLYDLRGGKAAGQLQHHGTPISSIAFHPSRQMLAAADIEGVVSVWDLEESKLIFSTDDTQGSKHCALVEQMLLVCSDALLKRYALPSFDPATPKPVRSGGTIGDVHTTASGMVLIAGINGAAVNLTTISVRAGGATGTGTKPAAKRSMPSALLAVAASKDAQQRQQPGAGTAQQRTRSEPRVVSHGAGAPNAGRVPPDHLQPLSAVMPPVPQSQAVAAAAERVAPAPAKRPSPPRAQQQQQQNSAPSASPAAAKPAVDIADLTRKGVSMQGLMDRRVTHTRMLRNYYSTRVDSALSYAMQLLRADDGSTNDSGAVVGLMDAIASNSRAADRITPETLVPALTIASTILEIHTQSRYVASALELSRVLWARHRMAINETRRGARVAVGVDLSFEARVERANAALRLYSTIKARAMQFITNENEAGNAARKFVDSFDD